MSAPVSGWANVYVAELAKRKADADSEWRDTLAALEDGVSP